MEQKMSGEKWILEGQDGNEWCRQECYPGRQMTGEKTIVQQQSGRDFAGTTE